MKTRITLLFAALFLSLGPAIAQNIDNYIEVARDVLSTEKKAVIAQNMILTDAESGPFWELYNEFNAELYKAHTKRVEIIKEFAASYESMSPEKADELWTRSMAYQGELLKLNQKYYKKFKQVIPADKAALYFQLENKIATLISAQLAVEIPLVEVRD